MKHDKPETMRSMERMAHEHRNARQKSHTAGRKNQEHDLPKHTTDNPYKETTE